MSSPDKEGKPETSDENPVESAVKPDQFDENSEEETTTDSPTTDKENLVKSEPEVNPGKAEVQKPSPELSKKLESGSLKKTTKIPSLSSMKGDSKSKESSDKEKLNPERDPKNASRNEPFETSDLEVAWKEFSSIRRKKGKAQEQNIFVQPYKLDDDGTSIFIELNNSLQMDILEEIKSDLVMYLRNKLKNDSIMVTPNMSKENGKKMLYTNKEKLDHLAEKNPLVNEIQEKLGLDPDY